MQIKSAALVAASFMLGMSSALCQPLELKSLRIGQSADEVGKSLPGIKCEPLAARFRAMGDSSCRIPTVRECERLRELTAFKECYFRAESVASFGGAPTTAVHLWLIDGQLARITVDLRPADFDGVAAAISEKYGQPATDRQYPVRTMAGVEHQNRAIAWAHPDGNIAGQRYGLDVTQATISISSNAAQQRQADATPTVKERAKDL